MPALRPLSRKGTRRAKAAHRRRVMPKGARLAIRYGLPALAVAAALGTTAWLATGGAVRIAAVAKQAAIGVSAGMGLRVENVLVEGRARVSREDLTAALGVARDMPILAFDPHAAKARLEALPGVRAASVERRLPDTIYLRIVEREPFALWQAGGRLAVIDREGAVLTREDLGRYADLPLVVGEDAAAHAETIVAILRARPTVNAHVAAIVRVSGRRWDLRLANGTVAELPEDGAARAVSQLAELIARERILERNILAIDMRLPDRLVVRTAPDPARNDAGKGKARRAKDT